jgi:signal recognition particle GTPase
MSPKSLNFKHRVRIAKGSGVSVTELNTMLNKFGEMQQMMMKMGKFSNDGQNRRRFAGNVAKVILNQDASMDC